MGRLRDFSTIENDGSELFKSSALKVFEDRVEILKGLHRHSIPLENIASIKLGLFNAGYLTIATTGGEKYKVMCSDQKGSLKAINEAKALRLKG